MTTKNKSAAENTEKVLFECDDFFISSIPRNFVLCRRDISKKDGSPTVVVLGHYPTIGYAFRGALEKLALDCENMEELNDLCARFEDIHDKLKKL